LGIKLSIEAGSVKAPNYTLRQGKGRLRPGINYESCVCLELVLTNELQSVGDQQGQRRATFDQNRFVGIKRFIEEDFFLIGLREELFQP